LVFTPHKLNELKTEMNSKKYMLEKPKQFGGNVVNVSEEVIKNGDKLQTGTKFARSAKELVSMESSFSLHSHKKILDKKERPIEDIPNQEETDPIHNFHPVETKLKVNYHTESHQKGT